MIGRRVLAEGFEGKKALGSTEKKELFSSVFPEVFWKLLPTV